ncbi:hypothetical protein ASF44_02435 [Pseudorhodoferax sp. Leaf274]|nr:hypothetical protein ASF44_02435 [Pseudorhodoferax sp. Leaf274]
MQWICASGVLAAAQSAAAAFEREHGLAVELRDLADGAAQLEASVACETHWRRGLRARVDSPLECWIARVPGPVLCITEGARAQAEALRAFVPAGRGYLGLWGEEALQADAIALAAWQLVQAGAGRCLAPAVD